MLRRVASACTIVCSWVVCVPAAMAQPRDQGGLAGAGIEPLTTVRVASGLNRPVFATHAPGDFSRLFIVEQRGVIKILDLATKMVLAEPFLDIDVLVGGPNDNFDERGLLGLAFHPDYQTNGYFYVNYTNNSSDTSIRRFTVSGNPDIADPASFFTLLTISQPFANHNGGWMGFGPNDDYLYIATGDGGFFCDPGQRAQDITNQLLGKMLRIDVDGDDFPKDINRNYAIPPDNPFVGVTGDDEIWAYGLRNPWRSSFDRETGDLYIADVGQNAREEIDYQPAASRGGENYGWDCEEGTECANSVSPDCAGTANGCSCGDPTLVNPIHEYTHSFGFSITGG
ncbi:MAG: PQQ-dependent sugar dehydrogenase [Planctomycetota bacterium]|nr:PQQ-dependent sugar dehydrogenase [Planctomycetota bacterium]